METQCLSVAENFANFTNTEVSFDEPRQTVYSPVSLHRDTKLSKTLLPLFHYPALKTPKPTTAVLSPVSFKPSHGII